MSSLEDKKHTDLNQPDDGNEQEPKENEDVDFTELRKFERRTLKDRRRLWNNRNYKKSNKRYHQRRCGKDRRDGYKSKDDLGKYIP